MFPSRFINRDHAASFTAKSSTSDSYQELAISFYNTAITTLKKCSGSYKLSNLSTRILEIVPIKFIATIASQPTLKPSTFIQS